MLQRLLALLFLWTLCHLSLSATDTVADSIGVPIVADSTKEEKASLKEKLGRFVSELDSTDSRYIEPNYYNYTAMLQNTNFFQTYSISSPKDDGSVQSMTLSPRSAFKLGPYFGWRWLFLGYTFNVARPSQAGKTSELSLSLYSSKIGIDYVAIRSTGDFTFQSVSGFNSVSGADIRGQHFGGMASHMKKINLYYIFNSKRFSYPAAFNQSTVQRRSAGSWIVGLRYDNQDIDFDGSSLPTLMRQELASGLQAVTLNQKTYSFSFGYGYNWAFAHNWLLAGSISPALGYTHSKGERITGRKFVESLKNNLTNLNCVTRLGLVYNNTRWFAGLSVIHYFNGYRYQNNSFANSVVYTNIYIGFNFHKRKAYRKHGESIF